MAWSSRFEISARALVTRRNLILTCRVRGSSYYFLPGGHVEFRETAEGTLQREFREEFGVGLRSIRYIGTNENVFKERGAWHHELNIIFTARTATTVVRALEPHLEACWIDMRSFARADVRPHAIRDALTKWLRNGTPFWTTEHPRRRS